MAGGTKMQKRTNIWGDKKIKCLLKTQIEVHCEIILSCVDICYSPLNFQSNVMKLQWLKLESFYFQNRSLV